MVLTRCYNRRGLGDTAGSQRAQRYGDGWDPSRRSAAGPGRTAQAHQDAWTWARRRESYTARTAAIVSAESGGSVAAAAFSVACASVRAPGIAQVTPSNIRIQRSASWPSVAPRGHERPQLVHRLEPCFVWNAGERLSLVERFAVAVELAVIVGREHRVGPQLAGQQAARERHAREDADLALLRLGKHALRRLLPEHVEDDLHGLHVRHGGWRRSASSTVSTLTP